MRFHPACSLALALALSSCARLGIGGDKKDDTAGAPFGSSGIPPQLRARTEDAGTPVVAGGNAPQVQLTPEEDIVFTNPDDPDASLPELSALFAAAPKRRGPWELSETIARKRAAREGKPLLIWFTDTKNSPMCKALSQELFSTPEFEEWASEKVVRLRVDANEQVPDPDLSLDEKETRLADLKAYVLRMKKQYKVLGQPTIIMVNPAGGVIGRYRGYERGQSDFTWGLIKQGEAVFENSHKSWRAGLEKKGYRDWSDRSERKVFAKLTSYSNGTLILIEPDGTRCRTHENKLSEADREWINQQKKLRGL